MDEDEIQQLDAIADANGWSRSEALRRLASGAMALQRDQVERQGELEDQIQATIEDNQTARNVLPSKWRAHVRRLFLDDIQDDASPKDLRYLASRYRQQARQYSELMETIPNPPDYPDGTHEQIVDEELQHALEAADLSNWYERVDNPFGHLQGVQEGREERETVQAIVKGVLKRHYQIGGAVGVDHHRIGGVDIPSAALAELPDRVDADDVAEAVNQLAANGVQPEEVDQYLPILDLTGDGGPIDVESDVADNQGEDEDDGARIRMGGRTYSPDELEDDGQAPLPGRVPALDGGRSDGSPFAQADTEDSGSESDDPKQD